MAFAVGLLAYPSRLGRCSAWIVLYRSVESDAGENFASHNGRTAGLWIRILVGQFVLWRYVAFVTNPWRKVEEDHPELMDLFNCAVDLTERKSLDEMNAMERRVVEEASQKTADLAMEQSLPKTALRQLSYLVLPSVVEHLPTVRCSLRCGRL